MLRLADLNRESFPGDHVLARDAFSALSWQDFLCDLAGMRDVVRAEGRPVWALFETDTYRFLVGLVALLAENRRVYLPGENHAAVITALEREGARLLGEFDAGGVLDISESGKGVSIHGPDFRLGGDIVVFTSGSTGQPAAIRKSLRQLDAELAVQETLWGERLRDALVLGTVSHQHLYGLLFIALWPLCSGRTVWRRPFVDPVLLARAAAAAPRSAWIMGPAHLHRLGSDMPWDDTREALAAIFSSGGPLRTSAAREVFASCGQYPVEILGSSETGGIAWREQRREGEAWTTLPGVEVRPGPGQALEIRSPFLAEVGWHRTGDAVRMAEDGRFVLLGRLDRIAKIEGKRVSLEEVERALRQYPGILDSATVVLDRHRQFLGAALVLSDRGRCERRDMGARAYAQALRAHLGNQLPSAAIPRAWRFVPELPRNSMGKLREADLRLLFDDKRYPRVLHSEFVDDGCRLRLRVDADCPYLEGHFPGQPVLPGVVQVFWADHFARLLLGLNGPFRGMRALKFRNLVLPGTELELTLKYSGESCPLEFRFESAQGEHSQGRMQYEVQP